MFILLKSLFKKKEYMLLTVDNINNIYNKNNFNNLCYG